jgi:hypothetical protein
MSTITLEKPAEKQWTLPQEQTNSTALDSYQDIISAPDPGSAFEAIADDTEKTAAFLQAAETDTAMAAANLELGLRKEDEKQLFSRSLNQYQQLLGLVVVHNVKGISAKGVDRGEVKAAAVNTLTDSAQRIMSQELEQRLDHSLFERTKEKIGRSKVRRFLGKLACTGAEAGALYLTWRGVFGADIEQVAKESPWWLIPIAHGAHYTAKTAGEKVADKASEGIDEYASVTDTKRLKEQESRLGNLKKELYLIAGSGFFGEIDPDKFVAELQSRVRQTLIDYYKVDEHEDHLKEGIVQTAAAISAGVLGAEKIDRDSVEALANVIPETHKEHSH